MSAGLILYRILTECLGWFAPLIFGWRLRRGKENQAWVSGRFARNLPPRPKTHIVWLHGASIGESLLNLEVALQIAKMTAAPTTFLFTTQTLTAAHRLRQEFPRRMPKADICIHQMAPLDSARISDRFLQHWRPDLALFAEGEIWPHLLLGLQRRNIPTFLINARMTKRTLTNWAGFERMARRVFACFTAIIASNPNTHQGLASIYDGKLVLSGNLKSALAEPETDTATLTSWRDALNGRSVLLAASTHAPEENDLIQAWNTLSPRPFLIIAPRHPARGDALQSAFEQAGFTVHRRSQDARVETTVDIYLADTIGEMGLWYRLSDCVYLGGGHARNVGGHNPLEALRLGKPVLTGPDQYNFATMSAELSEYTGYTILPIISDLPAYLPAKPVSKALSEKLNQEADAPMTATLKILAGALTDKGIWI